MEAHDALFFAREVSLEIVDFGPLLTFAGRSGGNSGLGWGADDPA
jgi:hypothetical protein